MSDSSSVQLYYVEEDVWGEIPVDGSPEAPTLKEFRFTNEDLSQTTETAVSEEIRSDRQVSDIVRTAISAGGEVGIELSYGSHDDLIAGALYDEWSTEVNQTSVNASLTGTSPGPGTLQLTDSPVLESPNWLLNLEAGQWIRISGSANSPSNNGFYRIESIDTAAGTIILNRAPIGGDEAGGTFNIRGQFLRNSTTRKSFLLEKDYSDALDESTSPGTAIYQNFRGMRVGSLNLNIAPGAILNGSLTFEGKRAFSASATVGDGSPSTVSTDDVMNAVDNITDVFVNGVEDSQLCFTNIEFTVENNLRAQPCIGQLANSGIGLGRCQVTGTLEAYLENRSLIEKYFNFDTVSLSFRATLGGDSYVFDFPSVKFTTGGAPTPGNDQDVLVSVEFNARRDPTLGYTLGITRVPNGTS